MNIDSAHKHPWRLSLKHAASLQSELSNFVRLVPYTKEPQRIVAADVATDDDEVYAAAVVLDFPSWRVREVGTAAGSVPFPYRPGYQAFHEAPVILKALKVLRSRADLVFFHAQGVCHPRLFGMASHLGLLLNVPSIGVTRERLVGQFEPPGERRGDYSPMQYAPGAIGAVLRTRESVKPIFISPGHLIDLMGTIEWCLNCCTQYRLPEPLRRAHIEAGRFMRLSKAKRHEGY